MATMRASRCRYAPSGVASRPSALQLPSRKCTRVWMRLGDSSPAERTDMCAGCRTRKMGRGGGFGVELARSGLSLAVIITATSESTTTAHTWRPIITTHGAGSLGNGPGGLLQCGGNDLRGQVQVLTEVLNPLVGQIVVVVAPSVLCLDESLGVEAAHQLNADQVGNVHLGMLLAEVLLGNQNSLLKEVLVDLFPVLLGH
mmetsp:Transcript_78194/g.138055  ORF Transcript_78194/g.138055 Transcript_78194/m.138055 type:complete len:200 (-) Transcript_78194:65-664(-)